MAKVRLTRLCAGAYRTKNTSPVADIARSLDHPGVWVVAYGDYSGRWPTREACIDLIESVARYAPGEHAYPIQITA